jgi:tripartite-type tricarboxylate transporter receptor subunit TctC
MSSTHDGSDRTRQSVGVKRVLVPAVEKAVKTPELKAKLEKLGYVVDYKTPLEQDKVKVEDYETANAIALKIGLRK